MLDGEIEMVLVFLLSDHYNLLLSITDISLLKLSRAERMFNWLLL